MTLRSVSRPPTFPSSSSSSYPSRRPSQRLVTRAAFQFPSLPPSSVPCDQIEGCWVAPSQGRGPVRGIVHFLGGAFAGAAPQLLYPVLVSQLASRGYTVIATPFPVTFQHRTTAASVHNKFLNCIQVMRRRGLAFDVPEEAPIFGVGHSMGSHLHLLIGSIFPDAPYVANVLMSYNNKPVTDAIPIPGLLETLPGILNTVEPLMQSSGIKIPSLNDIVAAAGGSASDLIDPAILRQYGRQVQDAADQIPAVLREVARGGSNFVPTPSEARLLIGAQYNVRNTLFLRFMNDTIDETAEMYQIVSRRHPGGTLTLDLPGSHVTPLAPELNWQVGREFSPLDALGMGVKAVFQQDAIRTTERMIGWMDNVGSRGGRSGGGGMVRRM